MMNRREFGKALLAAGSVLALPSVASSKPAVDLTWSGPHLAEFDNNDAIISTAMKAIGTLWYGNIRPEVIHSPPRVMGRVWSAIQPSQRVESDGPWIYSCWGPRAWGEVKRRSRGFLFCGAIWLPNVYLTDEIILINNRYPRNDSNHAWKKLNGWYRASEMILRDPYGDRCFEEMQRVIG